MRWSFGHHNWMEGWASATSRCCVCVCVVTLAAVIHAQGDAMMEDLQS